MAKAEDTPPLVEAPDYRVFDLRGDYAYIGYVLGQADPPFKMQPWWWPPPSSRFAEACLDVVKDIHPHLIDELRAYADAQRLPLREFWRCCCRINLKARISVADLPALSSDSGAAEGCSTFVRYVSARSAAGGSGARRAVVGRNYDYLPKQTRRQRIRFVPDCCANATIGARGSVPAGRYDGLNQHGVFASLHVVMTDAPGETEIKPGVPFHLVVRLALELCRTAREACDLLTRIPHLSSLNYLVADPDEAFVVEADPRRVRVIEQEGEVLAVTNHYRHPDMLGLQGGRASANSACRLAFLMQQGGWDNVRDDIDELLGAAARVMADRSAPICGLQGATTTLWSCVAELTTRRIRYAAGLPCCTPYQEMPAF
jgi:hypothetical protein